MCLTGAGISTPSGIPDFRTPGSGMWKNVDPFQVASIQGFAQNPQRFYDWLFPLAQLTMAAKPNATHLGIAELEQADVVTAVITQNIDMLHQKAGSQTIYEVHGHVRQATCIGCGATFDGETTMQTFLESRLAPTCRQCGDAIKPDVILFGELLPFDILQQAHAAVESCDVLLVAGSSLEVAPVNQMPIVARQSGAKLIFINLTPTRLDGFADVLIQADVVDAIPQLVRGVLS